MPLPPRDGPRLTSGARLAPAPRAAGRRDANAGARDDDDGARKSGAIGSLTRRGTIARASSSPPRGRRGRADRARGRDDRFPAPRAAPAGPRGRARDRHGAPAGGHAILRALSAAQTAPGGLRATLGDEPALLAARRAVRRRDALPGERPVPRALDANVVASPIAESLVGTAWGRQGRGGGARLHAAFARGQPRGRLRPGLITALSSVAPQ